MIFSLRHPVSAWNPWAEIEHFQADVQRALHGHRAATFDAVPLEIAVKDDVVRVRAALPGVDPAQIALTVEGDQLALAVERTHAQEQGGAQRTREERWSGRATRTIALPFQVDAAKTTAKYVHGLLTIELPRLESDKPRRIAIDAARS